MITRRAKDNLKITGVLIFLAIICIYFLFYYFYLKPNKIFLITPEVKIQKINSLENAVKSALEGSNGTYAVAVKNLKNGESYFLNEHQVIDAGSLYKLWIMTEIFNQIQKGDLSEDEILSEDVSTLNNIFNIPGEDAELTEGTITLSVADSLSQMISISHNYAALLLTKKIRLSRVDLFLGKNGFNESTVGINGESPTTTASDIALFFEKLYKGVLGNQDYTNQMIDLLKKQQLNNKLPKNLPQGVIIAHKTGELGYFSHDGGIVFSTKGDYIIVVLSKSDIPAGAEDRIAQISKNVYEYFEK